MDGSAIAYRSFFSFLSNPLTTSRGLPTGAVFGFITTLLRILEQEKPEYIGVVFDSKEKTFRHQEFPAYKATREKMPDEMADQIPYIQKLVEALNIPFIAIPTYEADDIIGTLSLKASQEGITTFMVSGDKDFYQLLGENTFLYNLKKGEKPEILGIEAPQKKWGITVEQVTDLLALMGDSSDNVPGVPGVGEKTACKLLQEFGSIKNLFSSLDQIPSQKLRDKLKENYELVQLCKKLVTIKTDVPVPLELSTFQVQAPNRKKLQPLLEELEFHSLFNSPFFHNSSKTTSKEEEYLFITEKKSFEELIQELQKTPFFVLDTETTSLNPLDAEVLGLSFCFTPGKACFVSLRQTSLSSSDILASLKPLLENPQKPKGGQNIKFDRSVLMNHGIQLKGILFDTMVESYLLDPESRQHNLDALARKHLQKEKIPIESLIGSSSKTISMAEVPLEKISVYACEDADVTFRLHQLFEPQLKHFDLHSLYQNVEVPLIEVLGDMERLGISIDLSILKKLSTYLKERLAELTQNIYQQAGEELNIQSPKQLGVLLFEKLEIHKELGIKRIKKTKTGYSTDQRTLEIYSQHPLVANLLEFRNLAKLQSTYVEALPSLLHPKTKRIHTSYNQTVTATGRLSSSDPNLQNIPTRTELGKEIRKAFVPGHPGWKILSADYSQIELRILAHLSKDPTLIKTFQNNEDIHSITASLIFNVPLEKVSKEIRNRAKAINFGVIYGMGPQRLAQETKISLEEAKKFIEVYFETYSSVRKFLDEQIQFAKENGYVKTLLGRRRNIPDINHPNPRFQANAERIATNTPIQGSAADLIKVAMVKIHQKIRSKPFQTQMIMQVHDELVFEGPETEITSVGSMIVHEMSHAIPLKVPLVVDLGIGNNWAEAH